MVLRAKSVGYKGTNWMVFRVESGRSRNNKNENQKGRGESGRSKICVRKISIFSFNLPYFNNFKIRAKVFQKLELCKHCCDRVIRYQLAMKGPKTILDKEAFEWRFNFWFGWNCTRRACSCILRRTVCWLWPFGSSTFPVIRHPFNCSLSSLWAPISIFGTVHFTHKTVPTSFIQIYYLTA